MPARTFLPVIGLVLLATLQGSGQVVIDMPAPRGKPLEIGAVALNRYAGARDAPLYGYVSPAIGWPWYRYRFGLNFGFGFGFPHFGFGSRCFGGYWGMVRTTNAIRPFR